MKTSLRQNKVQINSEQMEKYLEVAKLLGYHTFYVMESEQLELDFNKAKEELYNFRFSDSSVQIGKLSIPIAHGISENDSKIIQEYLEYEYEGISKAPTKEHAINHLHWATRDIGLNASVLHNPDADDITTVFFFKDSSDTVGIIGMWLNQEDIGLHVKNSLHELESTYAGMRKPDNSKMRVYKNQLNLG